MALAEAMAGHIAARHRARPECHQRNLEFAYRREEYRPRVNSTTVAELKSFGDSIERERQEFLSTLSDTTLHAPLNFKDMGGNPYSVPLVQLLQHVVNHGTYHRGQVTTMLRQAGAETVALDMLFFFREQNAAGA